MKFKVGQVWKDRVGDLWDIISTTDIEVSVFGYVLDAIRQKDKAMGHFTPEGKLWKIAMSDLDLIELISPLPKKSLNFWEARQAALSGKRVKKVDTDTEFTIDDFMSDDYSFDNYEIKADWEVVDEPKLFKSYLNIYKDGHGQAWNTKAQADSEANPGRVGCIEITTDENGEIIDTKKV